MSETAPAGASPVRKTAHRKIILPRLLAMAGLAGAILFFVYDLVADALFEGEFGSPHFIIESIVFAAVSWALIVGAGDLIRLRARLERERRRTAWLSGVIAENIDDQMKEWGMTRSEKDIAWLIIKGYRFNEIARLRGVKETTTRLQATTLYAKAGVSGRAELVAEFILPLLSSLPKDAPSSRVDSAAQDEER